jgi:hypothetical protein
MTEILLLIVIVLLLGLVALQVSLFRRQKHIDLSPIVQAIQDCEKAYRRTEQALREEMAKDRSETSTTAKQSRQELIATLKAFVGTINRNLAALTEASLSNAKILREEVAATLQHHNESLTNSINENAKRLYEFSEQLDKLMQTNGHGLDRMRDAIEQRLSAMQETIEQRFVAAEKENSGRLDHMQQDLAASPEKTKDDIHDILDESVGKAVADVRGRQREQFLTIAERLGTLGELSESGSHAPAVPVEEMETPAQSDDLNDLRDICHESTIAAEEPDEQPATSLMTVADDELTGESVVLAESDERSLDAVGEGIDNQAGTLQQVNVKTLDHISEESTVHVQQIRENVSKAVTRLGGKVSVDERIEGRPAIHIYLGRTQATDADLVCLEGLVSLQTLGLAFTRITDAGLSRLKGLTNLQSLDLGKTRVTNTGLAHLEGLTNLRTLGLSATKVTDAAMEHLKAFVNLEALFLWRTKVGDGGLRHLQGLTNLRTLDLSATKVTNSGLGFLKRLMNLHSLDLSIPRLSDGGLRNLHGLANLQWVNLIGTKVSNEGVRNLRRTLPHCMIENCAAISRGHTTVLVPAHPQRHGFLPSRKKAKMEQRIVNARAIQTNVAKSKATEPQIEVWLEGRKAEHPSLNWTLDTVRRLVKKLRLPLVDVLTWNIEGLTELAKMLGISLEAVFDSRQVLEAANRKYSD